MENKQFEIYSNKLKRVITEDDLDKNSHMMYAIRQDGKLIETSDIGESQWSFVDENDLEILK